MRKRRDNTCRICHQEGHFARDCPNKEKEAAPVEQVVEPAKPEEKEEKLCYLCHKSGHLARYCPKYILKQIIMK